MSVRRSFEMLLESAGLEYMPFETAESFLSSVKATHEDLLLLDINLPDMNGIDLLGKLVEEKRFVPAIIVSSVDDVKVREYCKTYGVLAMLRKPVDGETLVDLVRYHMHS